MRKIISLVLISLVIGIQAIYAQTPSSQSPASGIYEEWSSDSQIFVYQNTGKDFPRITDTPSQIFMAAPYWEAFNPQTGTWYESNVWPLYPNLSAAERSVFQTEGFVHPSLDGEILIYPSLNNKVTIANRITQQIFETDIDYLDPNGSPIKWSDDGQGLAVEGAGDSPYLFVPIVYYIRLRDRLDLTQTQIYFVGGTESMIVGNRVFTPVDTNRVFDVHNHQVLTTMSDLTNFGQADLNAYKAQSYLVIWNPENPEASVIIDAFNGKSIQAAAFVPNKAQQVVVILGEENEYPVQVGLYMYDIQNHNLQLLMSLDGYYIPSSYFSPDGNWLALSPIGMKGYSFFKTSDLLALQPLAQPTAFPTLTPPPTYTMTPYETPTPTHTPTRQG